MFDRIRSQKKYVSKDKLASLHFEEKNLDQNSEEADEDFIIDDTPYEETTPTTVEQKKANFFAPPPENKYFSPKKVNSPEVDDLLAIGDPKKEEFDLLDVEEKPTGNIDLVAPLKNEEPTHNAPKKPEINSEDLLALSSPTKKEDEIHTESLVVKEQITKEKEKSELNEAESNELRKPSNILLSGSGSSNSDSETEEDIDMDDYLRSLENRS